MRTLLALIETLIGDPTAKAAFADRPDSFLAEHGFQNLDPDDVRQVLLHAADTFPPAVAAQMAESDGLQGAAAINLHDLGLESLDDWSPIDGIASSGVAEHDAPLGVGLDDVAFDRALPAPDSDRDPALGDLSSRTVVSPSFGGVDDGSAGHHHDSFDAASESPATEAADFESADSAFADVAFDAGTPDQFESFEDTDLVTNSGRVDDPIDDIDD